MFGKFVAVALPILDTLAENVVGVPVVGVADTDVLPAVRSGKFCEQVFELALQVPFEHE